MDETGMAAAWAATARRMAAEEPPEPPAWLQMALARPARPPAWVSSPPKPAGQVDPKRMMKQLHDGIAAIEADQEERARRNGDQARQAMQLYEDVRRAHLGQAGRRPSLLVAAQLGLSERGRIEVF